jgi:exosortase A
MHVHPQAGAAAGGIERSTLVVAGIVLIVAYVLTVHLGTTESMVAIWRRSETFAHGFLIVPIFLYLVWRERAALAALRPAPFWPALAGIVLAGVAAWLGEHVNAVSVPQFAMVAMIPLGIWAVFGTATLRALAYPLAFLFFAVPFGEFLMPRLIDWTADFTVAAIAASGVPIYREGNSLWIPSGRWSIVEACSGLRYLIASVMVGVLFAYLSYRTWWRRALFIVASVIVPIIANWLRAYMIVMLGHVSGNRIAVGVDHLIYGWIFFGVVMGLLFFVGTRWREDTAASEGSSQAARQPVSGRWAGPMLPAAVAAAVVIGAGAWFAASARHEGHAVETALAPLSAGNGWEPIAEFSDWHPDVYGATATLRQSFAKDGARVGLHVALFREQTRESKAITSQNLLVQPDNTRWVQVASGRTTLDARAAPLDVHTAIVSGGQVKLAAYQWFWVDGETTTSRIMATLYQARAVLRGRGDAVAWVVVYASVDDGRRADEARVSDFVAAVRPGLERTLVQAAADAP